MIDHTQDYYAILGLTPSATSQEIKGRYRVLAQRLHPDKNPNNLGAHLQFTDIQTAYDLLSDEVARRSYDNVRERLADDPQYFFVNVTPSKGTVSILGEPQVIYYLIEISANPAEQPTEATKTPVNLCLILDRSKSMRGNRLDRVKVAAHQIIDQLSEKDFLSVVTFSDRADHLIPSQPIRDKNALKAMVSTMTADGGTEIYQGLSAGVREVQKNLRNELVNHIILLTDGETYDDENLSIELAEIASIEGLGISTMGIGEEWNDVFLDEIASKTGGSSAYVNSPQAVVRFLNDKVRSLGAAFGERMRVCLAPDPDVHIESVFKLSPNPQAIEHHDQPLLLGGLEPNRPIKLLVQMQLPDDIVVGERSVLRTAVWGDILHAARYDFLASDDTNIQVAYDAPIVDPPRAILDALGKLTLYRMQQKAEDSIRAGNFDEATRRLENLATRLLDAGQAELANTVMREAQYVKQTKALSAEGQKTMKFGTRLLLDIEDDEVPS